MKRMLPTLAALAALSLTSALPVRADTTSPADSVWQAQNRSTSMQDGTDAIGNGRYSGSTPARTLTPRASEDVRISTYPHETPGYQIGQTRLFGSSGGR